MQTQQTDPTTVAINETPENVRLETPAVTPAPYSRDDEEIELPRFLRMPTTSSLFSGWGPRVRN